MGDSGCRTCSLAESSRVRLTEWSKRSRYGSVWPSGLGFLPDGSLVVATMQDGLLVRWDKGSTSALADLSSYGDGAKFWGSVINDMVVDGRGNAYVGVYGRARHDESGIVLRRLEGRSSGRGGARDRQWHGGHAGWQDIDHRRARSDHLTSSTLLRMRRCRTVGCLPGFRARPRTGSALTLKGPSGWVGVHG